jgi:putative sugar O-methyltransferase
MGHGEPVDVKSFRRRLLETRGEALLDRTGLRGREWDRWLNGNLAVLPGEVDEYLQGHNHRLAELSSRYRRITHDGVRHSKWTDAFATTNIPLQSFRSDCAFLWQYRDLNLPSSYSLTYFYLLSQKGSASLLDVLSDDDMFGAYGVEISGRYITRDLLDSVAELSFLSDTGALDGSDVRVLDIGSGYGRFALRLAGGMRNVSVICVDAVAVSTFICEFYTNYRREPAVRVVPLDEIDHAFGEPFDLAVNIHSFSECSAAAVSWWLKLVDKIGVRRLFIVPNALSNEGATLLSRETDCSRVPLEPLFASHNYKLQALRPKYACQAVQQCGVSPTHYYLFEHC